MNLRARLSIPLAMASFAIMAQANLVVNGGFENPGAPVPDGLYISYYAPTSFPGWSVGAGASVYNSMTMPGYADSDFPPGIDIHDQHHTPPHSGMYSLDIAADSNPGSISQILSTTPGQTYFIDLWYAGHPYHPYDGPAMAEVHWNGLAVGTLSVDPSGPNIPMLEPWDWNMNWTHFQAQVTATSSDTVLELYGLTPNGSVIFDDVSVEGVPDAGSSAAMLMLGMLAMVGVRRRMA